MKKIFLMVLVLGLVFGCASKVRYHRPGMYESTTSETAIGIAASVPQPLPAGMVTGALAASSETAKFLRVYPECADWNTSQGALFECVREIDIKEGRIKPEDLKKLERPNLDDSSHVPTR